MTEPHDNPDVEDLLQKLERGDFDGTNPTQPNHNTDETIPRSRTAVEAPEPEDEDWPDPSDYDDE